MKFVRTFLGTVFVSGLALFIVSLSLLVAGVIEELPAGWSIGDYFVGSAIIVCAMVVLDGIAEEISARRRDLIVAAVLPVVLRDSCEIKNMYECGPNKTEKTITTKHNATKAIIKSIAIAEEYDRHV